MMTMQTLQRTENGQESQAALARFKSQTPRTYGEAESQEQDGMRRYYQVRTKRTTSSYELSCSLLQHITKCNRLESLIAGAGSSSIEILNSSANLKVVEHKQHDEPRHRTLPFTRKVTRDYFFIVEGNAHELVLADQFFEKHGKIIAAQVCDQAYNLNHVRTTSCEKETVSHAYAAISAGAVALLSFITSAVAFKFATANSSEEVAAMAVVFGGGAIGAGLGLATYAYNLRKYKVD